MTWIIKAARAFSRNEVGVSIVEYALMLALITIVCIAAMTVLGAKISNFFSSSSTTI